MHTVSTVNSHSAQMSDALVIKMVIVYSLKILHISCPASSFFCTVLLLLKQCDPSHRVRVNVEWNHSWESNGRESN